MLSYTANGTKFGNYYFSSYREVDQELVKEAGIKIEEGWLEVKKGIWIYMLSSGLPMHCMSQ